MINKEPKLGDREPCNTPKQYLDVEHRGPSFDIILMPGREFCLTMEHLLRVEEVDPDSFEVMPDGWIKMKKEVTLAGIRVEKATADTLAMLESHHMPGITFTVIKKRGN